MYDVLEDFEEKTRTRVSGQTFDESAALAVDDRPAEATTTTDTGTANNNNNNSGEEMLLSLIHI